MISPSHSSCCSVKRLRSFRVLESNDVAQAPDGAPPAGCWLDKGKLNRKSKTIAAPCFGTCISFFQELGPSRIAAVYLKYGDKSIRGMTWFPSYIMVFSSACSVQGFHRVKKRKTSSRVPA